MDNKYGFETTSLTLVEKLSRGEDWDRFVNLYYRPVVNKFNAINRTRLKDKREIDEVDEGDVIADIFKRLKKAYKVLTIPKKDGFASGWENWWIMP